MAVACRPSRPSRPSGIPAGPASPQPSHTRRWVRRRVCVWLGASACRRVGEGGREEAAAVPRLSSSQSCTCATHGIAICSQTGQEQRARLRRVAARSGGGAVPVVPRWPASGVLRKCESVCVCVSHGVRNRFVRATAMPSLRGRALRERVVRGEGVRMRVCAIAAFGGRVAFACPWKSAGNQLTNSAPRPCQSKKECTLAPYAVDARQLGCTPSAPERSPPCGAVHMCCCLFAAQRLCPAQAPGRKLVRIVDRK